MRAVSSIYETEPVGYTEQPSFLNMVAQIATSLPPHQLLDQLIGIERQLGRERTFRNAPRIIDLDILLHGDAVLDSPALVLPHPRMRERAFVLMPLVEIDPTLRHPVTGEVFADLLAGGSFEKVVRIGVF